MPQCITCCRLWACTHLERGHTYFLMMTTMKWRVHVLNVVIYQLNYSNEAFVWLIVIGLGCDRAFCGAYWAAQGVDGREFNMICHHETFKPVFMLP
ncbi:hypothetical protein BHE74_00033302 [Ensete ventricosum]|nr:hypothetical protein GW17_00006307 [Ensete ventricosum]RWW59740.1 hypothetical protein BHE74_00033302 [Ensete ventricosum]RZS10461.1 hypothetical protein BHM03_00041693 [Ensete ventricosum]